MKTSSGSVKAWLKIKIVLNLMAYDVDRLVRKFKDNKLPSLIFHTSYSLQLVDRLDRLKEARRFTQLASLTTHS